MHKYKLLNIENPSEKVSTIPIESIYIDLPVARQNAKSFVFRTSKENKCTKPRVPFFRTPKENKCTEIFIPTIEQTSSLPLHDLSLEHESSNSIYHASSLSSNYRRQHTIHDSGTPQNYNPRSWLEMSMMGHALSFSMEIEGREVLIIGQNSTFLAQEISKGMCITTTIYG